MLDKMLYNTILSQTLSPCGKYLVAGNIYGQIAVFDLDNIFNPVVELLTSDYNKPKQIHTLESGSQVCSLITTNKFLVVGTVNQISGWDWKAVGHSKLGKPSWTIEIRPQVQFENCDINCLWCSEDEEKLYAGCGDNIIYVFNLEDGRVIHTYEGHSDFVHCVHGNGQQLISSGEDGLVLLWDRRTKKSHNKIVPHSNSKVQRPDIGKWVGAAALDNDWIVCGGGPRLSLWHLRSLDVVTVFDIPDKGIHVSLFHDDCVFAGGVSKQLYQLSYAGDVRVELPVSATTVYSALLATQPRKVLSIAGSSPEIDLCTTFNYRDQVLHFR
ncbi:THO complex subunit 6 [Bicyclus anynana]|uniref:THO complex subunit 6 n=1 Tax=Bicyclus anynana TaxID=110368 RepID=A0A1C9EGE9_BICAN|nr:THO complex subunit 6 [Bicyclus anynana]AON96555.1 THO complex subunit 6 [Bicyclus anynana]